MTLTAVVTAHAQQPAGILRNLFDQTRPPDEVIVLFSDLDVVSFGPTPYPLLFLHEPNMNDWGHAKRAKGLELATSDYVGFFNADDSYDLAYIEKMMAKAEEAKAGFVYCNWSQFPRFCEPKLSSSTSGNFIVFTYVGNHAGYTSRAYEADGHFIDAAVRVCKERGLPLGYVEEVLYHHNLTYT